MKNRDKDDTTKNNPDSSINIPDPKPRNPGYDSNDDKGRNDSENPEKVR